jgi:hypothetical protein
MLDSASYLRLSLVCARGTPVVEMLAHSPLLPLIINHIDQLEHDVTAEDEEGIILALRHRDRVRRIRLMKPFRSLQKLVIALDGEYPILEYLLIEQQQQQHRPVIDKNMNLKLPETFRAPHLRHLMLRNFAIPIASPILANMGNLVTLSLMDIPPAAYFNPDALVQRLSLTPQLETFGINFNTYPTRDVEGQILPNPDAMRVTLFFFWKTLYLVKYLYSTK